MANVIFPVNVQTHILTFLDNTAIASTAQLAKSPWLFPTPLSFSRYGYEFATEEMVAQWVRTGEKIGLFIGRRPFEALPIEEGIRWISMDPEVRGGHPPLQYKREPHPKRYHLHMSFCPEVAQRLQYQFEKVVVDQETFKCLDDYSEDVNISSLTRLLNPQGEAHLVFEPVRKICYDAEFLENFQAFIDKQGIEDVSDEMCESYAEEERQRLRDETIQKLHHYFREVRSEDDFSLAYPLRFVGKPHIIPRYAGCPYLHARSLR